MQTPDRNELHANQLSCRRGGRRLFESLGFRAASGMLVRVTGPNGSGKTTLLRLIAGLGMPDTGSVLWNGTPLVHQREAYNAGLAWLGHSDGIKAELTPRENLRFHQALVAEPDERALERALGRLGVAGFADRVCRTLSMGQRRRSALARLALGPASLWLLDEPLTALDPEGQQAVHDLVRDHCRAGGITVLTSHHSFEPPGVELLEVALG